VENIKDYFENKPAKENWETIGYRKRAGVVVPLFAVYSAKSHGIGDFADLKQIIKWCNQTGLSILQLLPLNDVGFDFSPYNSVSSFAIDPMYVSLKDLKEVNLTSFKTGMKELKKKFKNGNNLLDYGIKEAKISLLFEIYYRTYVEGINRFKKFKTENKYWLEDYALYKVIKEINKGADWSEWSDDLKSRDKNAILMLSGKYKEKIDFYKWMQWQLYEQLSLLKKFAINYGVLLTGDIPFLVSRDSADVWAHQNYFRLNLSSGAPPDMYLSLGQRWGMPPYNWDNVESDGYKYIKEKLIYARNFYNMYRIDHFIGVFRLWTIENNVPEEKGGLEGKFIPEDENLWENHGKKIINSMLEVDGIMPCAEDLGTVPHCSYKTLDEYGVTGIDVQRWNKDWNNTYNFKKSDEYRINSVSTVSTHDSSSLMEWWKKEAGTIDEELFRRLCALKSITGERYIDISYKLFSNPNTPEKRLYWKDDIRTPDNLLEVMGLSYSEAWDIISLYKESYDEKKKFLEFLEINSYETTDVEIQKRAIEKCLKANSVFSVHLLNEWLSFYEEYLVLFDNRNYRVNFPGIINETNWRKVVPVSVDLLQFLSINKVINQILNDCGRC